MQSDPYVRAILTFIALCLLVLVAQGYGLRREEPEPEPAEGRGQWTLQMVRTGLGGPPTLLRVNTASGEVWHTRLGANQDWALVGVAKQEAAEPAPPAPPPAPAQPAAPAPEAPPEP